MTKETHSAGELYLRLRYLNRIGIALSSERDLTRLLDRILLEARRFTRAEAGTLYTRDGDDLVFELAHNEIIDPSMFQTSDGSDAKPRIPLNPSSLAGHVGVHKEVLNIEDVYHLPPTLGCHFNDRFDRRSGYRTRSMLLVPMLDVEGGLVGVLQLINARTPAGEVIAFDADFEDLVHSLASQAAVALTNANLTARLKASYLDTIMRLAIAAEYRDVDTANHIHRMSRYSAELASVLDMGDERVEMIQYASVMHDVGKIGISDSILLKPGKLTDEEFEEMQSHTRIGARILSGSDSEVLQLSEKIALTHHEKFDGGGYPNGLAGREIPIEGRIVALADVFDALTSKRCYKPAFPVEKALSIIRESAGSHFDPDLVDMLPRVLPRFLDIKATYQDIPSPSPDGDDERR